MGYRTMTSRTTAGKALLTGLALSLAATACAGDGGEVGSGTSASTGQAVPATQQEMVVGYTKDPWIDSAEIDKKRLPNYPLNADVCETLVVLTPDFQVGKGLATAWESTANDTFKFTLREGAVFSDGTPVTAEAVKFSLDYTVKAPSTSGFAFLGPNSVTVLDPRTVQVKTTRPNRRLIEQITHPTYSIMKPGSDPLTNPKAMICSGAFKVSDYVAGERLVVVRNEMFSGEATKLSKITFRFLPDDTTRTLALQNGEVDLIAGVPRSVLDTIKRLPDLKVEEAPVGQVLLAYVARRDATGKDKLLADPLVRRAVAHAIDQKEYVEGVLDNNAKVVKTVAPPAVLGDLASQTKGVPFDPAEANKLLDQAGWVKGPDGTRTKDGKPLQLTLVFSPGAGGTGVDLSTLEWFQAQLKDVGIVGKIDQVDEGAYRDRLKTGNYDLDFSGPNQNDGNPAFLLSLRWYSKATGDNVKIISPGPNTEFEALIDKSQEATEFAELQRLAADAMRELVDDEVGAIPLAGVYRIYAMKKTVQGFKAHPSSTNQRWSTVFLSK